MQTVDSRDIKVSVIVPVYKVDKYLKQCLESVVNQTLRELEIIIVDEGDMDRCREIIDEFERRDSRIVAPHQKNGGYGASCNLGLDLARGEYIAIVESDDYIEPSAYEEMYAYASSLGADVVKSPYYKVYSDGDRYDCPYRDYLRMHLPKDRTFSVKEFGHLLSVHASVWSGLYKRTYMETHNIRFVEARGAAYVDVGFRIETLIHTDKIAYLDKPYYNYRIDNDTSSTNNFSMKQMIQRWKEVHESFGKDNKDYDCFYGPFLIFDEYLNSVAWLHRMEISEEEQQGILYNLSFVKDEVIVASPVLNRKQKNDLLQYRSDSKNFIAKKEWDRRIGRIYLYIESYMRYIPPKMSVPKMLIGGLVAALLVFTGIIKDGFMFCKYILVCLLVLMSVNLIKKFWRRVRVNHSKNNYIIS